MALSGGDDVRRVKQANDLVAVIQEYVELQRNGRNFKVCCPFHEGKHGGREKTPSLYIYPDKQTWHCFGGGCGAGGTVIDWVMRIENLDFKEALQMLAKRAGIELQTRAPRKRAPGEPEPDDLYALLAEARDYFEARYPQSTAESYVRGRGIDEATVRNFHLGYAPDAWENMARRFGQRYGDKALLAAGLVVPRDNGQGAYDRFRDRLIFPIVDAMGRVLGFGARDLGSGKGAKYINTPQTEVYNKSVVLFGIDKARDAIRQQRHAIIMEGYTDVMLAHQFGITNAVASCGTALTEGHLNALRTANQLTFLFDGDVAGTRAAERAVEMIVAHDTFDARIVVLPDDLDPADYLLQHGREAFDAELARGLGIVEFKLDVVRGRHDLTDPMGQRAAIEECMTLIKAARSQVFRDVLVQHFAQGLGVSERAMRGQLADEAAKEARRERFRQTGRDERSPGRDGRPAERSPRRGDGLGEWALEETAIAWATLEPALAREFVSVFGLEELPDGSLRRIATAVVEMTEPDAPDDEAGADGAWLSDVLLRLGDADRAALIELIVRHIGRDRMEAGADDDGVPEDSVLGRVADPHEVFARCVERVRERRRQRELEQTRQQQFAEISAGRGGIPDSTREAALRHLEQLRAKKGRKSDAEGDAAGASDG